MVNDAACGFRSLPERPAAQLQQQIAARLRELIHEGVLPPGDRLMEVAVAKLFGVSRSPARRALEILRQQGLLDKHPTRGFLVSGRSKMQGSSPGAVLEPVQLAQSRLWEGMYAEVEQHLLAAILFASVRISDRRLAEHFGVSRTVTRDLLAHMHGTGLISKERGGHWVSERITPERVHHLFAMRKLLEPHALRDAAPHVDPEYLIRARDHILATLAKHPLESSDFDRAETDLHIGILGYAPNKEILRALRPTHLLFAPTRHLHDPVLGIPTGLIEDALHEHLRIVELLLERKGTQAANVLHEHLEAAVSRWLKRLEFKRKSSDVSLPPYLTLLQ
ncbi:DNA-binding GntR family transcriptional regulator [Rhodoligotrophos appendicifer]|uniref:GntR family transcriptional regulator n=1 Tax=Rhodoligotrophos appendicifer TaxID=987056 RepID=UPI00147852DD|nr:GntR family transcriptional regulator [Rhodoligotrophos appendicifer]